MGKIILMTPSYQEGGVVQKDGMEFAWKIGKCLKEEGIIEGIITEEENLVAVQTAIALLGGYLEAGGEWTEKEGKGIGTLPTGVLSRGIEEDFTPIVWMAADGGVVLVVLESEKILEAMRVLIPGTKKTTRNFWECEGVILEVDEEGLTTYKEEMFHSQWS